MQTEADDNLPKWSTAAFKVLKTVFGLASNPIKLVGCFVTWFQVFLTILEPSVQERQ